MKKLIYALAALLIAGGAYWAVSEQCSEKESTIEKTPKCEDFDNCVGCPNALEEIVYDEFTIDSLNIEVTNIIE